MLALPSPACFCLFCFVLFLNQENSFQALSPLFASFPGKSALHWAAAVNNVDAAVVLLKNGANKDMQNNKVSRRAA